MYKLLEYGETFTDVIWHLTAAALKPIKSIKVLLEAKEKHFQVIFALSLP